MILTIRTDRPEAEVGLYDANGTQIRYKIWTAHRELSATLLGVIRDELQQENAAFGALKGIVVFRGPGSFTGLRIGITVANAMSYALHIPIIGTEEGDWQLTGISQLRAGVNDQQVLPNYGGPAHITPART